MRTPKRITYQGQQYVRADWPVLPGMGGRLTVGPHMPHQSPQPSQAVRPPGGGQSAGGPGGPSVPVPSISGPGIEKGQIPSHKVRKRLRRFLHRLRKLLLQTVDLRDVDLRQLLANYKLPAVNILLNEWHASHDRIAKYIDDAEMELATAVPRPTHTPSLEPGRRLPQEPWPSPANPFTGPQNR